MVKDIPKESDVYSRSISYLQESGWEIFCASPPGGTDARFKKCLFPRRSIREKGPRDEVDIIAFQGEILFLIEAKPKLSDSLSVKNARNESDDVKLRRLLNSHKPIGLSSLLKKGFGVSIPSEPMVILGLAIGKYDAHRPEDMTILDCSIEHVNIDTSEEYLKIFS